MANFSLKKQPWDIVDEIVSISGLYKKIFGDLLDLLVYNQGLESDIDMLQNVFWFEGVRDAFKPQVERKEFRRLSKIIFRFYDGQQQWILAKQ